MNRWILCLALLLPVGAVSAAAGPAASETAATATDMASREAPVSLAGEGLISATREDAFDLPAAQLSEAGELLGSSPLDEALAQARTWQIEATRADDVQELQEYGSCSATVTCPGVRGSWLIVRPYPLSCQGSSSCNQLFSPQGAFCGVECDGQITRCYPWRC